MSTIQWNKPEIQCQIHDIVEQMAVWNGIRPNKSIRQHTQEYYNDKLVSCSDFWLNPFEFKEHIERAMEQHDCIVSFEDGALIKVVRSSMTAPKKFVTTYYKGQ